MAYNEALADRVRAALGPRPDITEIKMFGGICFMTGGNMLAGVSKDDLMLKVDKAIYESALTKPGARPWDFSGRTMVGMLFVDADGTREDGSLASWVSLAYDYIATLPPKQPKAKKPPKAKKSA